MTTEDEPVIDRAAANEEMIAEMQKRAAEEAVVAAAQDAALQAVKDQCDAFRAALATEE
jgi:hypothetical protein